MSGYGKYVGCNPVDYNVSDNTLIACRRSMLKTFFRIEYKYKKTELFSNERLGMKAMMYRLRNIVNDINRILIKRGFNIKTSGYGWKLPVMNKP